MCEIKFSQREIGPSVIEDMQEKIAHLNLPKHFSYRPVLIHVNGVSEELVDRGYFTAIVNFGQMCSSQGF